MNNPDKDKGVEIIHRRNRLKEKVIEAGQSGSGPGFIDPEAIRRAQNVIDNGQDTFMTELKRSLNELTAIWENLKTSQSQSVEKIKDIHRIANHIKDMAATFKNALMDDFGTSLRDFSDRIDITKPEHITIAQAHIDVMWIAFTKDIKDIDAREAVELKRVLEQAIQKYSAPSS
ncbi:MAG: hypothetical protein LRY76_07015 [Alphaproteobacteria bacterium]|nr:hypothetical protein [Alphaproteobacteria bacterium]MCD8571255.1 hypothetical protein [Alphaproteobacteria bacterium]